MNRKKVAGFFTVFLLMVIHSQAQSDSVSFIAEHYQTKKFDVAIFPANSKELFPGNERFTPSKEEVDIAEQVLNTQLASLNSDRQNQYATPIIDKNLAKYKRQYFGYIDNKANRILFINCFWKKVKEEETLWLNERIRVLDGGSYFWNVKFNINKNELFDLEVNGDL